MHKPHYTIVHTWYYAHTCMHIHTCSHRYSLTHAHMFVHMHAYIHTYIHKHAHIHIRTYTITYVKLKGVVAPSGGLNIYVLLVTLDMFNHWQRPRSLVNIADPPESAVLLTNSIFVSYIYQKNHRATRCSCIVLAATTYPFIWRQINDNVFDKVLHETSSI